jgi:Flp pilus assembly protein CpaB
VDAEKSAAGLLKPGDRVDVQLFVRKDQRTGINMAKSKVILQNIRVFAVDQAVQRSAEGGDEKTIAKTVSLMLTPDQASKLSLAEQIGEISLIPRNPDDEEASESPEYTVEDLLAGTEKSSRAKEQGDAKAAEEGPTPNDSLLNAINNIPKKEPFRMEIVEAQNVHEVLFDADTGRPIRPVRDQLGTAAGPMPYAAPKPSSNGGGNDEPTHSTSNPDASDILEDFPINFNELRKK